MYGPSLLRRALPTSVRVKQYIDHLFPKDGRELLPMNDILPSVQDGVAHAVDFQRLFVDHMAREHGGPAAAVRAWTVTLPGDALLRNMGHSELIVSPLPAELVVVAPDAFDPAAYAAAQLAASSSSAAPSGGGGSNTTTTAARARKPAPLATLPKKKRRLQSVEMTLAAQFDAQTLASPEPTLRRVAPALVLRGSRYPFYAPHVPGFAADLSSCALLAVGPAVDVGALAFDLCGMGTVLSLGIEPVAVGYVQRQHLDAPAAAAQHAHREFDPTLRKVTAAGGGAFREQWWFTSGCLARVPAAPGEYLGNFGLLGSVALTLTE
jgi:hypothetical protein